MPRDYKDEYQKFQSSTKQKQNRAKRNKIRRKFLKLGKVTKGDNKDIHHTSGISNDSVEVISSSENKGKPNEGGRRKGAKKRRWLQGLKNIFKKKKKKVKKKRRFVR